jgi:hypothetical protein
MPDPRRHATDLNNPLRPMFAPMRPELDRFLFAAVGEERNDIPLSMISALTQLGLDPWDEAGRLCSLARRDAVDRLTELIIRLPGEPRPLAIARQIAAGLVDRLPAGNYPSGPPEEPHPVRQAIAPGTMFWAICFLLLLAAIISMLVERGGFPLQ